MKTNIRAPLNILSAAIASYGLAGCISFSKMTVKGAASIAEPSQAAFQDISDLESWRRGGPAGIQMLEGMHEADPSNVTVTAFLAKAYNGYATLVAETDMMDDQFLDRKASIHKNLAVDYHARAIDHARSVLIAKGLKWNSNPDALKAVLNNWNDNDPETRDMLFILGQSMKSLVGLKRGSAAFLDLQPLATTIVEAACSRGGPSYPSWGCKGLAAVELSEKPVVAGGNPKAARQDFDGLIAANPEDLMLVALRAQFVLTKVRDPKAWQESKDRYLKYQTAADELVKHRALEHQPRDKNALSNAAAAERLRQLIRYERDLF